MTKKKIDYQGSVLFQEGDAVTPATTPQETVNAPVSAEAVSADMTEYMGLQEKYLTQLGEFSKQMAVFKQDANDCIKVLDNLQKKKEETVAAFAGMSLDVQISPESKNAIMQTFDDRITLLKQEANDTLESFKKLMVATTDAEINRIRKERHEYYREVDFIHLCWYPHGYIIIGIFAIMFTTILGLLWYIFK